jgi:malonyl-CoA O-methyltransferase
MSSNYHNHSIDSIAEKRWKSHPQIENPWLNDEIGQRMAKRLVWINTPVTSWLNWEPVQGGEQTHALVRQQYPNASFFYHSSHLNKSKIAIKNVLLKNTSIWQKWRGLDAFAWMPDAKVDLLWANMVLHQYSRPQELLHQWQKTLNPNGFLMFSCLGPDSLRELKWVYQQLEWGPAAHDYMDMHDWGDLLMHSGFAEPVMDMEYITLTYQNIERLLLDLRQIGRNLHPKRSAKTMGRSGHRQWCDLLTKHWPRMHDGQLGLTFEVVYGHAHKPLQTLKKQEQQISLSAMRQMLSMKKS